MDDHSNVLECHLELMHALQNRQSLRQVQKEDVPKYIGGCKPSQWERKVDITEDEAGWNRLSKLQIEFLRSSLAMQNRLRPKLIRMQDIRAQTIHNEHRLALLRELHCAFRERYQDDEVEDNDAGIIQMDGCEREGPRLLFQLQRTVERIPGWLDLQQELRKTDIRTALMPIDYDGFYVIRAIPSRNPTEFRLV